MESVMEKAGAHSAALPFTVGDSEDGETRKSRN